MARRGFLSEQDGAAVVPISDALMPYQYNGNRHDARKPVAMNAIGGCNPHSSVKGRLVLEKATRQGSTFSALEASIFQLADATTASVHVPRSSRIILGYSERTFDDK